MSGVTARLAAEERRRSESAALIAWVEARAEAAAAAPALSPAELADLAVGCVSA